MTLRKKVWLSVGLLTILTAILTWPVDIPCDQCGKRCMTEPVMARMVSGFDTGYLHFECVDQWCQEHPIQFDDEGHIIRRD